MHVVRANPQGGTQAERDSGSGYEVDELWETPLNLDKGQVKRGCWTEVMPRRLRLAECSEQGAFSYSVTPASRGTCAYHGFAWASAC